jgi:hypothetical protein
MVVASLPVDESVVAPAAVAGPTAVPRMVIISPGGPVRGLEEKAAATSVGDVKVKEPPEAGACNVVRRRRLRRQAIF